MSVTALTQAEFSAKISDISSDAWKFVGDKPCIVDFQASWCRYCKALAPIFNELSEFYAGKVDFYSVDSDKEEALATHFKIQTVPTVLLSKTSGEPLLTLGVLSKVELKELIENTLLK